jgi:hypothetical protein
MANKTGGTRANKNKGRRLQKDAVDLILKHFPTLNKDDVRSTPMGMTGADVLLSQEGKRLLPFSIECKNQENRGYKGVYRAYEQAQTHYESLEAVAIIKENGRKPLAVLSPDYLFQLQAKVAYLENNKQEKKTSNGYLGNCGIVPITFSTTIDATI